MITQAMREKMVGGSVTDVSYFNTGQPSTAWYTSTCSNVLSRACASVSIDATAAGAVSRAREPLTRRSPECPRVNVGKARAVL